MSPNRTRARRWLVERGLPLGCERSLAEHLSYAEGRGEERVLALIANHIGVDYFRIIDKKLAQSRAVTPVDRAAQSAEDVVE